MDEENYKLPHYDKYNLFDFFTHVVYNLVLIAWVPASRGQEMKKSLTKFTFTKRMKLFRVLCARSWKLFFIYLKDILPFVGLKTDLEDICEILVFAHGVLGSSGLCAGDEGSFLKLVLHHMQSLTKFNFKNEILQCYKCLHGTVVKISPEQKIEDHLDTLSVIKFGEEAALDLFFLIEPFLMEKIDAGSYRQISNDIRQCLDMVSNVFPNPPMTNTRVAANLRAIQNLLESDLDIRMVSADHPQPLAVFNLSGANNQIKRKYYILM